nr:HAD hydrolase-like protein [uncultured Cohaesibacter sp.]
MTTEALDEAHDQFLAHYASNICKTSTMYPGVQSVIEEFGKAGIKMGVCTNKTEVLAVDLLTQLGVASAFATICGSDTVTHKKPHPDHVLTALKRMGAEAVEQLAGWRQSGRCAVRSGSRPAGHRDALWIYSHTHRSTRSGSGP